MRYFVLLFVILASCTDIDPLVVSKQPVSLVKNDRQYSENHISISMIEKEITYNNYSKTLANSIGLKTGLTRGEAVDIIRLHLAPRDGVEVVSTAQAEFKQNDYNILLYSAADKSKVPVIAEEIFISFNAIDMSEFVADFGIRIKCLNDNTTSAWQAKAC